MIIPRNLCRMFVYLGRRGRRLPVAIVLRFDRVGRREPAPTGLEAYIPFGCRGWRPRHPDVVLLNKMYFKPCRGAPVWAPVRCSINCAVNRIVLIFHTKSSKFLQYFQKRSCQNIKVSPKIAIIRLFSFS